MDEKQADYEMEMLNKLDHDMKKDFEVISRRIDYLEYLGWCMFIVGLGLFVFLFVRK